MSNLSEKLLANPALIQRYVDKKISAAELADKYNYSVSYVLTTLSRISARRPINPLSTYQQQVKSRAVAKVRKEYRRFLASQVVDGTLTAEEAALAASCSARTIARFVQKLRKGA